jgi:hypothetical protein
VSPESKVKITMHNIGNIDSIANVIFVAKQNRYAPQNAAFLYHGIVINFNAAGYGRSTLSENLSRLDSMEATIGICPQNAAKFVSYYKPLP